MALISSKKRKISRIINNKLFIIIAVAFIVTMLCLWIFQTGMLNHNAEKTLRINISDVKQDINDASDSNLLELCYDAKADYEEYIVNKKPSNKLLDKIAKKYDLSEIDVVNNKGIIKYCTNRKFVGFDMGSGAQSRPFNQLINRRVNYVVQPYQPISYDKSISRKYAGVPLDNGGYIQVGYDAEHFQKDIDSQVVGITRNRHVGEKGGMVIASKDKFIVSDTHKNEGKVLSYIGFEKNFPTHKENVSFRANIYGQDSEAMYSTAEGYYIIAVMPQSEIVSMRNSSVLILASIEVAVFVVLFVFIFFMLDRLVLRNLKKVNKSLSKITDGDLDEVVDIKDSIEFDQLSNDINSTVNTLKQHIKSAEERIDAELAFAKAIQTSVLPSEFPPFPDRKEFDIWAGMATAKEVGGDFYDFFFVDDDKLVFLVADVSDKGIPAAMFMMISKTIIKSYAESGLPLVDVIEFTNKQLCGNNKTNMFVTVWIAMIDLKNNTLEYVNAGHNPPGIKRNNGRFELLVSKPGFVVAGLPEAKYTSEIVKLNSGDELFLYTDGLTEATNKDVEQYSEKRLLNVLNKTIGMSAEQTCDMVKDDVDSFVGEASQFDDITMLSFKLK